MKQYKQIRQKYNKHESIHIVSNKTQNARKISRTIFKEMNQMKVILMCKTLKMLIAYIKSFLKMLSVNI